MHNEREKMRLYRFTINVAAISYVAISLFVLSSCKDTVNSVTPLDEIVFPASGISYAKQVQPLFNVGCALPECHDNTTQKGNLDLTSHAGLLLDPGVVIAKNPTNSRLVWRIEALPPYSLMPPAKSLSQNQIQGLKQWIVEGARGDN
jgi:Planctomycete cytochrome C